MNPLTFGFRRRCAWVRRRPSRLATKPMPPLQKSSQARRPRPLDRKRLALGRTRRHLAPGMSARMVWDPKWSPRDAHDVATEYGKFIIDRA